MAGKMNMRQFRRLARDSVAVSHVSRVRADVGLTASTVGEISLLTAADAPNYDLASDGTNIANCESNCRLKSIKLTLNHFAGTSNGSGARVEWLLYKDPDSFANVTAPSDLFVADLNTITMSLRKHALAYGGFYSSSNNETKSIRIGIKRRAMRRIQIMHENDVIKFMMITAATGSKFFIHGTLTWAK